MNMHDVTAPDRDHRSSPQLIVIAASAGGLRSIVEVLSELPSDFPAAIAIVQHRGSSEPERLVQILAAATVLQVCHASDRAILRAGTVYVCPPGVHMTAEHCSRLVEGPKLHFVQPNADLMFESVARSYGHRALGVVLSGAGSDGAVGSLALSQAGGVVLAQDAASSEFPEMPLAATRVGATGQQLSPTEIANVLQRWAGTLSGQREAVAPNQSLRAASAPIRVLIADDHRMVSEGLRILLENEPDMAVVSVAEDGEAAVRMAQDLAPDVVVMDIRMPGRDGVSATEQILAQTPMAKVLALSSESDARSINAVFRAGASGYITKHHAFGELARAIRSVIVGRVYLSQEVARLVAHGRVAPPSPGVNTA